MSRWDDIIIEQMQADALAHMGEAEWREMYGKEKNGYKNNRNNNSTV